MATRTLAGYRRRSETNIGEPERRVRLLLGGMALAGALYLGSLLVAAGADRGWRLVLFPVFYQGVRFIFDYRLGACPLKAELGQRRLDGLMTWTGDPIRDARAALRIRSVSRRANLASAVAAAFLTVALMLL